jgi:hypothetical protein
MADITLETISNDVAVLSQSVTDLRVLVDSQGSQVGINTSAITVLQNPPTGVPAELLAWFALPHAITDVDSVLNTRITTAETNITGSQTNITALQTSTAQEVTDRTNADNTLSSTINDLQTQVTNNLATLTQEVSDRSALSAATSTQDDATNTRIDGVQADLATQTSSANTSINSISSQIASINASLQTTTTQITLLQGIGVDPLAAQASQITTLTTIANNAATNVAIETTNRINGDLALQASINGISSEQSGFQTQLNTEVNTRTSMDATFTTQIGAINITLSGIPSLITAETAARIAADSTLTTNVATNTANIAINTGAISTEIASRISGDANLQTQVTANTGNITTNTANITANTTSITSLNAHFGIVKNVGGYVTGWQINDNSAGPGDFRLFVVNNDSKFQNPGYVGKYFSPVSVAAFSPPVSYDTQYGVAANSFFHGADGNNHTVPVLVYATQTVAINGSVFKGVDYSTGGDFNRLGQVLTTFLVNFSGSVNRYLSLWYRIKTTPTDTTQTWFPVALADNTISGARTYEIASTQAVVQISVTSNQVIEFGLTSLNTFDASIADPTKTFIYGGNVSVTAYNMTTIS